jgi:aminotransferase
MRLNAVKAAGMGRVFVLSRQFSDCINLGLGEPDFPGPESALVTGFKSAAGGRTRYEPTNGTAALREALAERMLGEQGLEYDSESEVLVTVGATEALSIALLALVNLGDHVLVPDPGFVAYEPCVAISEGKPVSLPLYEKNGFSPFASDVTSLLTRESRVILLNFPNNPTGSILSHKEARELAKLACERDLLVISDEVYEKVLYDGAKHECMAVLLGMRERTLVIGSF